MPTYEFKCNDCGEEFDEYYPTMTEYKEPPPCKKCGSNNVDKLISGGTSVIWKDGAPS